MRPNPPLHGCIAVPSPALEIEDKKAHLAAKRAAREDIKVQLNSYEERIGQLSGGLAEKRESLAKNSALFHGLKPPCIYISENRII